MTISTIILNYYNELKSWCQRDIVRDESKTDEDILHNVLITALNKYGKSNISESEGYDYLVRTLKAELHFKDKRDKHLVFTDTLPDVECQPNE